MKLMIVSDGTREGTKVVNKETMEVVENVQSIVWVGNANADVTVCDIRFNNIPVDLEVEHG